MKKFFKILGIIFGVLILIYFIVDITFSIQLHNKIAELKRQGRPTTIAEIIPPPVPDEENATILYSRVFELITWSCIEGSNIDNLRQIVKKLKSLYDTSIWTDEEREKISKLINSKEVQDIFSILEKGSKKPKCRFELEYEKGYEMELLHLNKIRIYTELLCVKAMLEAESGNVEQVFDTLLIGLRMSNHLKDEPTLSSQLMRIVCDNLIIECIEVIADLKGITQEQETLIMNELSAHQDVEPFVKAMDGERVVGAGDFFEKFIQGEILYEDLISPKPKEWSLRAKLLMGCLSSPFYRPIFKKDFVCFLTLLSKIQDSCSLPYYKIPEQIKYEKIEGNIPPYCILTRIRIPNSTGERMFQAIHQANIDVCRVGLALKIYKTKTGNYPETLDFLSELPIDPFSGKKLIYKKSGDGFILYSLGPNMKDDGGIPRGTDYKATYYNDYDIVWKCEK
ncbi:MAG: hypothetical protein PHW62_01450 [Candidatus Ratteibacteria bacterium]|nr:hypothetical protein [Candidatus Ratteibacteria bacterium]